VLTIDELRSYVDATWPADLAARHKPDTDAWEEGLASPPDAQVAYDLRYLLGRRLVQTGRYEDAGRYLPEIWTPALNDLRQALASGRDEARPAGERAHALFRAACLTRHQGMELLGTELEPDWHMHEGTYEQEPFADARAGAKPHQRLGPTKDEAARVARHQVTPAKRFHYRYAGADLARAAAKLLPDGSVEKAEVLATGGSWIKIRDPKAGQPFYEALLGCCGDTDLARRARRLKVVPTTDVCPADTKPAQDAEGN
jgi:hypothetical protein